MADAQSTQTSRSTLQKLKGVRRHGKTWQANVRVAGHLYCKSFPLTTPIKVMRDWRADTREGIAHNIQLAAIDATRLPRSMEGWCYVYFAQSGAYVKIGRALNPSERLRTLQTAQAGDVALLACVAAHVALEAAIHKRFDHLRTRGKGEWFQLEPDLIAFIRAIQQGANPVALLFDDPRVIGLRLHPLPAETQTQPEPELVSGA